MNIMVEQLEQSKHKISPSQPAYVRPRSLKRIMLIFIVSFIAVFILVIGVFVFKAGTTFSLVSQRVDSFLGITAQKLPIANPQEKDRLDILILGIRGEGDPYGGRLTDTMIGASINTDTYQTALISVPRDTYVTLPVVDIPTKLNEAYEIGEQKQPNGGGIVLAKLAIGKVIGVNIDHAVVVDFTAFKELIDLLGGIDVQVAKSLRENLQWGGQDFIVEPGSHHMDGDTALLYARSRFTTSDFDRARRQQEIIFAIREKAVSLGFLSNPKKLIGVLDIVGRNVKTDIMSKDISRLFGIGQKIKPQETKTLVIDTASGLFVSSHNDIGAYILIPAKGFADFSDIHSRVQNIFEK